MREWTAEQGRSPRMKRKGVEGFPVIQRIARAANEDFPGPASDRTGLARTRPAWDPYGVWRAPGRGTGAGGRGAARAAAARGMGRGPAGAVWAPWARG